MKINLLNKYLRSTQASKLNQKLTIIDKNHQRLDKNHQSNQSKTSVIIILYSSLIHVMRKLLLLIIDYVECSK